MPRTAVQIWLDQRAIDAALRPRRAAAPALHPLASIILGEAVPDPADPATRIVTCSISDAKALLDYFDAFCHSLVRLGDPDTALCAFARDSIRRAIGADGA